MAIVTGSYLRSIIRRSIDIDGPYNLTKEYIELTEMKRQPKLKPDVGDILTYTTQAVLGVKEKLVLVSPNPLFYESGLVLCPLILSPGGDARPLTIRLDIRRQFDPKTINYLARLYVLD